MSNLAFPSHDQRPSDQTIASLSEQERQVLEQGGSLDGHSAQVIVRKLNDGLWAALLDIAREIDRLKG